MRSFVERYGAPSSTRGAERFVWRNATLMLMVLVSHSEGMWSVSAGYKRLDTEARSSAADP